jgi:hypothetical protein
MRFLYPARLEPYILKTIRDRWRQHKSDLKAVYFHEKKSIEVNYNNCPKGVSPDQWRALVNNWTSEKAKVHKYLFDFSFSFASIKLACHKITNICT